MKINSGHQGLKLSHYLLAGKTGCSGAARETIGRGEAEAEGVFSQVPSCLCGQVHARGGRSEQVINCHGQKVSLVDCRLENYELLVPSERM